MDLIDLDLVEAIRGPADTSFSRHTEGGAINFITKQPTGRFCNHLEVAGGEYGHPMYGANVDLPKFSILSVSLTARDEKMDGWARNLTGPPLGGIHHQGFSRPGEIRPPTGAWSVPTHTCNRMRMTRCARPVFTPSPAGRGRSRTFGSSPNPAAAYRGYMLGTTIQSALAPYITTRRPSTVSTFEPDNSADFDRAKNTMRTFTLDYRLNDDYHLKYIDTKFNTSITNPINQFAGPYANGFDDGLYVDNSSPKVSAASNLVPPYAPKNTFDVNINGRLFKTNFGNLRLVIDWSYVSTTYNLVANKSPNAPNTGGKFVSSIDSLAQRTNVNARLLLSHVQVPRGTTEFSLAVENLTNYDRPVQTIEFGRIVTADWEAPRMWKLTESFKSGQ